MSILYDSDLGCFISSEEFINSFINIDNNGPKIDGNIFQISSPYSSRKATKIKSSRKIKEQVNLDKDSSSKFQNLKNEIVNIKEKYSQLLPMIRNNDFLKSVTNPVKNNTALESAELIYEKSGKNIIKTALGSNWGPTTIKRIQGAKYIFPKDSVFFNKDVCEIETHLENQKFDLILLDPPWWNKYIRRKRKKCPHAYEMMYNCDLMKIPIETLLNNDGIVVVWCTNSPQHLKTLIEDTFSKWGVYYVTTWFWLKVTIFGEPICEFSEPPGVAADIAATQLFHTYSNEFNE